MKKTDIGLLQMNNLSSHRKGTNLDLKLLKIIIQDTMKKKMTHKECPQMIKITKLKTIIW